MLLCSARSSSVKLELLYFATKLLAAIALAANTAIAADNSPYSISKWPMSPKLSQETIIDTLTSTDGTLWIATLDGISRFDGSELYDYRPYKDGPGFIASSNILDIFEAGRSEIIVVSRDAGLLMFNGENNNFSPIVEYEFANPEKEYVSAIFIDDRDYLWIGHYSGLLIKFFLPRRSVEIAKSISAERIVGFTQSGNGQIYVALEGNEILKVIEREDGALEPFFAQKCHPASADLVSISMISEYEVWIGTRGNGLFTLDLQTGFCEEVPFSDENTDNSGATINKIFHEVDTGITWVATDQGLYSFSSKLGEVHFHSQNSNISDNEVISISKTNNGIYWIGTYTGLNYMIPSIFKSFGPAAEPNLESLVAIGGSSRTGIKIATYAGLFTYKPGGNIHTPYSDSNPDSYLTNRKVMTLHMDSDGMWVGYRSNGLEFESHTGDSFSRFSTKTTENLSSDSISAILTTRSGETLIGTYGAGLNVISPDKKVVFRSGDNLRVILLFETSNGVIWAGTESGLYSYDAAEKTLLKVPTDNLAPSGKSAPLFWQIAEASTGDLWLGTMHHGLFFWPREFLARNDSSNIERVITTGKRARSIYSMEVDDHGFIWCSTNSGLIRINPITKNSSVISARYGLQNQKFDFSVSHKDVEGNLYFGGSNGYVRFDPSQFTLDTLIPEVRLTNLLIADAVDIKVVDPAIFRKVQLTHKNYFVTFEFSVLDFIDPENNQFRYKLEGFDPDWIENGTRNTATYTNLPAGNYVFRVQGANSSDVWNREGISINVEVLPPPWFAWWAWCAYIGLFAFFSWLGKRTYDSYAINRRANDMAITMRENEERAYDDIQEHQELNNELITVAHHHNVATLALIRDFIEEQKNYLADELAADTAEKCIDIVTSLERLEGCLFFHDNGLMADLRKYTDFIFSEKIKASHIDHESIITINDVTPDLIPADLASPIALVIHEAVENAMQHAFVDSSTANYLQVSLSTETENSSRSTLSITDNGVGIPEQLTIAPANTMGLGIIYSMARKLSARIEFSRHNGTEVSLTFANQSMNKVG